jgi:metal-responsive CopG/Arc/MetJ family transcriptional regulator
MPQTVLKLPRQTLDGIDKLAAEQKVTRAEIMRQLLAEALEARRKHR